MASGPLPPPGPGERLKRPGLIGLKGHTESEVFAIQDQAVKTKYIDKHIYRTREDDKCKLCNEYKEAMHHITSGCPIYAQSFYLMRHNNVARYNHHRIASSFFLREGTSVPWYNHELLPVIENDVIKVLWDFDIQTDKHITSNRPDIVIVDKKEKSLKLIDVSIPKHRLEIGGKFGKKTKKENQGKERREELRIENYKSKNMQSEH